jgi:hypothetical protein
MLVWLLAARYCNSPHTLTTTHTPSVRGLGTKGYYKVISLGLG